MAFRFIHAADIHLDSPLRSLALRDPDLAELIGNATRQAFARIITLCLEEQVDALLLAGDLYDGEQTSMKTARFLAEQMRCLHEARIPAFIIRGNHDALLKIIRELTLPESVTVFRGRAEALPVERNASDVPVFIHGLSFAQPHAPESLIGKYKAPIEGAVNIGLMHTSLAGAPGHDAYAPCSLRDLQEMGFQYWALGHIHKRSVTEGPCPVVMAGMPQGRDINEDGAKSVTLVTVADDRSIHIEERLTSIAQFERLSLNVTDMQDWRELVMAVAREMERARCEADSEHLVVRLRLTGETPLAWLMRRDLDKLKNDADVRASEKCWIEKLEIDCRPPSAACGLADDPVSELRRLIDGDILQSDAYRTDITAIAEALRLQLPPECRDILGSGETDCGAILAALMRDGADDVLARLQTAAGDA